MKTYQAPAVEHLGSFASLTNDKGTGSLKDWYNSLNNAGPCSADPVSCGWVQGGGSQKPSGKA